PSALGLEASAVRLAQVQGAGGGCRSVSHGPILADGHPQCLISITNRAGSERVRTRMQDVSVSPTYHVERASKSPPSLSWTKALKFGTKFVGPAYELPPSGFTLVPPIRVIFQNALPAI